MKLYVIRHGRTNNNELGLFNGRNDEDLNEEGILQAKNVISDLKNIDINLIICSPMKRTKHTAEVINRNCIPIIYDERLIERDTGELTLKPYNKVDREEYWNYYSDKYKNIESVYELVTRVSLLIEELKNKYFDKNILLVTHNGVSRAIDVYFNGIQDGLLLNRGLKNCEIKEYEL